MTQKRNERLAVAQQKKGVRAQRKPEQRRDIAAQFRDALHAEGISSADFAKRIGATRAGVSRDLCGGLRRAKLHRLQKLAEAIDYEVVVSLLPRRATR